MCSNLVINQALSHFRRRRVGIGTLAAIHIGYLSGRDYFIEQGVKSFNYASILDVNHNL